MTVFVKINQLRALSPSQQIVLYDQLVAFMVFKSQAIKNEQDNHPIYSSLSLAFNERVFGAAQFHTVRSCHIWLDSNIILLLVFYFKQSCHLPDKCDCWPVCQSLSILC